MNDEYPVSWIIEREKGENKKWFLEKVEIYNP